MNKKRLITLLVAMCLVFALFAGCGGSTTSPTTAPTTTVAPDGGTTPDESAAPVTPLAFTELPHDTEPNLAVNADGSLKYEVDALLYPLDAYEYTLPLTTDSEQSFTLKKGIFDFSIVDENGLNGMSFQKFLRDTTGVNINYIATDWANLQTEFSLEYASNNLQDIILNAAYYYAAMGTIKGLIDDQYIINMADYRAYMPNYMYQIPRYNFDVELEQMIWTDSETIASFVAFQENCAANMGPCVRGDWLDLLGLKAEDITTYDDVHDMLVRFKNELGHPESMQIFSTVETLNAVFFGGMNTGMVLSSSGLPYVKIDNSQVVYTATQDIDKDAMTLISTWYAEDLIDKDWSSTVSTEENEKKALTGNVGFSPAMNPGTLNTTEKKGQLIDPNYRWDALPWTVLYDGFEMRYGNGSRGIRQWGTAYSSWSINAKCKNIPLVMSYADWMYSPSGGDLVSWGEEGVFYTVDEDGNRVMTDFVQDNVYLAIIYGGDPFGDVGLLDQLRSYGYPGGERYVAMMKGWYIPNWPFKGGMDWPSTNAKGTDEQIKEVATMTADVATYIAEHCLAFVDGTESMSGWDAYVTGIMSNTQLPRIMQIQQDIYDNFIAQHPDYAQPAA